MLNSVRLSGKPTTFHGVPGRGSQLLNLPGGKLSGLTLSAGASHESKFCDLRGGVVKFSDNHPPIDLDLGGTVVPCGHTLMDARLWLAVEQSMIRDNATFPQRYIHVINGLILAPARLYHPEQSLFPPYFPEWLGIDYHGADIGEHREHGDIHNKFLFLKEGKLTGPITPSNGYRHIIVSLIEGSSVVIRK